MKKEREARQYIKSILKFKRLSHEEMLDLARKWHCDKDQNALDKMIEANLLLVVKEASRFKKTYRHIELDELIQAGNIGLITACKMYDPEKNFMFSTYAMNWIRAKIRQSILKHHNIKNNTEIGIFWKRWQIYNDFNQLSSIKDQKEFTKANNSLISKWVKQLNTSKDSFESNKRILQYKIMDTVAPISASGTAGRAAAYHDTEEEENNGNKLVFSHNQGPLAIVEDAEKTAIKKNVVKEYCLSLPKEQQAIFSDLFLKEKAVKDVAKKNGITQQGVYALQNKLKKNLKKMIESKPIDLQELLKD